MEQPEIRMGDKLHEGKAKVLFATDDPGLLIQYFKDDATAFNGKKKGTIEDKGVCNNSISSNIFRMLEGRGVKTHFVRRLSEREMVVTKVEIILVEVVIRNIVAGSLAKRMGAPTGQKLSEPIIELYYKDDDLGDPMINRCHVRAFSLANDAEMDHIEKEALRINELLVEFFSDIGLTLVDYKLEFGRGPEGILLADEISPDGCRLWDTNSGEILDKDRFRQDLGNLTGTYQEVSRRVSSTVKQT